METLGVKNRNGNVWTGSNDKGSLLDPNKQQRNGYSTMESPLATQLQQAWLQTQLPKRNVPKLDFLSPLPSPDYLVRNSPDYYSQHQPLPPSKSTSFSHIASPDYYAHQVLPPSKSSSFSHVSSPDYYAHQAHQPSKSSSFSQHSSPDFYAHHQALPPSKSSSFSQQSPPQPFSPADSYSDAYTASDVGSVSPHVENEMGADSDPMEDDYMLQYLSDMLMDEDLGEKKCMYVQCSAYQAMNQELADLIGDAGGGPTDDPFSASSQEEERDTAVNSWIDEVLSSNPQEFLRSGGKEEHGIDLADDVSSIVKGITNISTGSPPRTAAPAPTSNETSVYFEKPGTNVELDCPYSENDSVVGVDYTNGRSGIESLADLYPLLMQCAQAVAADDVRGAHQLINQLRQLSSPFGDGGHRMTYYFVEALVARLSGTGAQLYTALSSNRPSAHEMLEAYRMFVLCNPLPKISHLFANASIMKAVETSDRIHIIDFGILYGVQWPCLLRKLAQRPGGAPHVRITGIDFAQPGFQKNDRVEETGRRLAEKAKQLGVEFEYHAIAGKWESIQPAQLTLRNDETLIVNCMFRLRNLLDETVMASSPRKAVLAKIHSLNPKLFTMGVISAGYNSPFFMARFRETINHFSALFDATHSTVPPDTELRRVAEKEILGREILNVIACEGTERIERAETYRQWQSRSLNAGFKQRPLDPEIVARVHEVLKRYHRNYGVAEDGNWLLTGWKDRVLHGLTTWTSG